MQTISENDLMIELARTIRELLSEGEEVHLEGLGTFKVNHRLSWVDKNEEGDYVLLPPCDNVSFTAD